MDANEIDRAVERIDEEIAAIRGRLKATTPTGLCMQTAHELGTRLQAVERAVRTLHVLAVSATKLSDLLLQIRERIDQTLTHP